MSVHEHPQTQEGIRGAPEQGRPAHRTAAIALGVGGTVAAFVGAFILLGGDSNYVQFGWADPVPATDVDAGWGYMLLTVGTISLVIAAILAVRGRRTHAAADAAAPVEPAQRSDVH